MTKIQAYIGYAALGYHIIIELGMSESSGSNFCPEAGHPVYKAFPDRCMPISCLPFPLNMIPQTL